MSNYPIQPKKILIAPLDWGLGHATRCIPIINEFLKKDVEVVLGSNGRSLDLLRDNFPKLRVVEIPGYDFIYPSGQGMVWAALKQVPKVLRKIRTEKQYVKQLQEKEKFDLIISDNRYGCFCNSTYNIFIGHQLALMVPEFMAFGRKILYYYHLSFLKSFQEIWIPDFEGENNLSGRLTHDFSLPKNCFFIGPQSRFSTMEPSIENKYGFFILILLSGPEPQRSILQQKIIDEAKNLEQNFVVVEGKTESNAFSTNKNITIIGHAYGQQLFDLIYNSKGILCRSGYSTIMDLDFFGKRAFYIPTPGQTEQEYLAKYMSEKGIAAYSSQQNFKLKDAVHYLLKSSSFKNNYISNYLLSKKVASYFTRQ